MTQTALGERSGMGLLETVGRPIPVASKDVDPVLGLSSEGGSGTASKGPRLWVDSIGGFGERDADGYVPGQSHSYWGFVGGYRHPIGPDWEIGLASAYAASRVESDDGLAHKDGFSVLGLAQARWTPGPWAIEGGLGLARHVFDGERRVAFTGFDETATGRSTSWEGLAQLDVRRDWTTPWGVISPLGGVALSVTREEGWSEKGGGAANLVFEPETDIRAQSHLGLGYERTWDVGDDLMLRPSVGLLWVANLGQLESGQRARFADGATSWQVPSLAEDRHSGAARIELGLSSGAGWSLGPCLPDWWRTAILDLGASNMTHRGLGFIPTLAGRGRSPLGRTRNGRWSVGRSIRIHGTRHGPRHGGLSPAPIWGRRLQTAPCFFFSRHRGLGPAGPSGGRGGAPRMGNATCRP
jgi:hypothetical protein